MAVPSTNTWELQLVDGGARRPSIDDVGSAVLIDDANYPPPRDGTAFYQLMCNQWQRQLAAMGRVVPSVRLTIDYAAGSPFIDRVEFASSLLIAADITVTRTSGGAGAGDLTLDWLSWKLPPLVAEPIASINDITMLTANAPLVRIVPAAIPATHTALRLVTPLAGTPADMRVSVRL